MTDFQKITEADSLYRHLEKMQVREILESINTEDRKVPEITGAAIPQIEKLVSVITDKMLAGGRLFILAPVPVAVWELWMPVNGRLHLVLKRVW